MELCPSSSAGSASIRYFPKNQCRAEDLLQLKGHYAILNELGGGKTTLYWYMVNYLRTMEIQDIIPVLVDFSESGPLYTKEDVILCAIQQACPNIPSHSRDSLANDLDSRLIKGTAILLIDNFHAISTLPSSCFMDYEKVICLGTNFPNDFDPSLIHFKISDYSDQDIGLFIRSLFFARKSDKEPRSQLSTIISAVLSSKLPKSPLFISLLVQCFMRNSKTPENKWEIIDAALTKFLFESRLSKRESLLYRKALTNLALSGYIKTTPGNGFRSWFFSDEILKYLPSNRKLSEKLYNIVLGNGFVQPIQGGSLLTFPLLEFQAALAVKALITNPHWLQFISEFILHRSWQELICSVAFQLGKQGEIEKLEQLFTTICNYIEKDPQRTTILLLCKCLASIDEMTRNKLELLGLGEMVREKLCIFFSTASIADLYEFEDILPSMWTDLLEYWMIDLLKECELSNDKKIIISRCLGKAGGDQSLRTLGDIALNNDIDIALRGEATISVGRFRIGDSIPILKSLATIDELLPYLPDALLSHNTIQAAEIMFSSPNCITQWDPSEHSFTNPEIITALINSLKSYKLPIHKFLYAIAAINSPRSTDILERGLYFERTFSLSMKLLCGLLDRKACDALIRYALDNNNSLHHRSSVVEQLPKYSGLWYTSKVCNLLFMDVKDLPQAERQRSAYLLSGGFFTLFGAKIALYNSQNSDLPAELGKLLAKASADQRFIIIDIMIHQNRPVFIPLFRSLLHDPDPDVRSMAFHGLSLLHAVQDPEEIIQGLKSAIANQNSNLRVCPGCR